MILQRFDAGYLERLRGGDADTERNFIAYFSELVLIKVRSRIRNTQLAEDIRQETLLRAFRVLRAPDGIRSAEGLGSFVNSICNNVLHESFRSQRRHSQPPPDSLGPDAEKTPEERLISRERGRQVGQILDALPARDGKLLRAMFLEERDKDELCAEFKVGRDYLRVLLHRAKAQFREQFDRQEADERPRTPLPPRAPAVERER